MLQPSAVGGEQHQVKCPLCSAPPPPAKDLLLIEAPYRRKTEHSSFGCKQMATCTRFTGHRRHLHERTPQSQCHPHPNQNLPASPFRMQLTTTARSKRHASMTVGLPFRYWHAQDISHVMERMLLLFFLLFFFRTPAPVGSSVPPLSVVVAGALDDFLI